jgi:hypothetical protein
MINENQSVVRENISNQVSNNRKKSKARTLKARVKEKISTSTISVHNRHLRHVCDQSAS